MAHPFDISPGLLLNNLGKQVASYNPADSYFRRLTVDSVYDYNMVAHLWQAVILGLFLTYSVILSEANNLRDSSSSRFQRYQSE
jgi:hypothetical protein